MNKFQIWMGKVYGAKIKLVSQGNTNLYIVMQEFLKWVWFIEYHVDRTIPNGIEKKTQEIFERKFIGIAWDEITPEVNKIMHQLIKTFDNEQGINYR